MISGRMPGYAFLPLQSPSSKSPLQIAEQVSRPPHNVRWYFNLGESSVRSW